VRDAVPALTKALEDEHEAVRDAAGEALRKIRMPSEEAP
jgi:HEAT repeat protein